MRKLILGILAVFCVQFAFVIFTALQSPIEVAVGPIYSESQAELPRYEPVEQADDDTALPELKGSDEIAEPKATDERRTVSVPPRRSGPQARPISAEVEEPMVRVAEKRPSKYFNDNSESAGAYETIVISYDRSAAVSDCEMNEPPKPRKRSYIAKAAPVVKKPWEWIKAVGSRFN